MADRHTLHSSHVDAFLQWLVDDGWELQEPKGYYEVIRAKKGRRMFIAFRKLDPLQHLSVSDRDSNVVRAFYNSRKKQSYAKDGDDGKVNHAV